MEERGACERTIEQMRELEGRAADAGALIELAEEMGEAEVIDELRTILAGGEVADTDAEAQLKAAGFGRRQIEHAADKLAVVRSWGRVDGRRVSLWSLPAGDAAEPGSGRQVGTFSADEWTGF